MVTAGSESAVCELGLRGFSTIKALSTGNNDPKIVSKPFDKNKDGFVLGEARQH